jgi:hypothetical protein
MAAKSQHSKIEGAGTSPITGNWDVTGNVSATGAVTIGGALDHNGTTVGFYAHAPVAKAAAPTAANAGTLNTGDATSDTIIGNIRTRLGEIEVALRNLGLIT